MLTSHRDPNNKRKFDLQELGLGLLAFLVLGLSAALAYVIIHQESNAVTLNDVKQTNDILVDCTTPGHKCYEDSKKNTAAIILQLINADKRTIIRATHCAAIGYTSVAAITECVNKGK